MTSLGPGLGAFGTFLSAEGLVVSGMSAAVCELPPPRSSISPVSTAASTSTAAAPIRIVFEFRKDAGAVPPVLLVGADRTAAGGAVVCVAAAAPCCHITVGCAAAVADSPGAGINL